MGHRPMSREETREVCSCGGPDGSCPMWQPVGGGPRVNGKAITGATPEYRCVRRT